jgi:hypothetical protein
VGLVLFPGNGDVTSPDAQWSYSGFAAFRRGLAGAEGFDLDEMIGFGGDRSWDDVETSLRPLLNRPDDGGGTLTVAECTQMFPRLVEIVAYWRAAPAGLHLAPVGEGQALVEVLRVCVGQDVPVMFL